MSKTQKEKNVKNTKGEKCQNQFSTYDLKIANITWYLKNNERFAIRKSKEKNVKISLAHTTLKTTKDSQ